MSVQIGANVYLPPSPVVPPFLVITNITRSLNAMVTVSTSNAYVPGQVVYFSVPFTYGMFQINTLSAKITGVDVTNLILTTNLNTSQFDAFVTPIAGEQPATIAPSGANNIYNNTTVPFHSQGNFGN